MLLHKFFEYFLPENIRNDKSHPKYDEFYVIASATPLGIVFMSLFPLFLLSMGKPVIGYYMNAAGLVSILLCMKLFGHYRIPMYLTAGTGYFIMYGWIKDSGLIYSTNVSIMHIYLLAAIWADKKRGWLFTFSNVLLLVFIYYRTITTGIDDHIGSVLGSPGYALGMHCFITVFLGSLLGYAQFEQERNRRKIRDLQDQKISLLDEAVKQRTHQLNNMRQVMAADFHDETGNMLSAITRQAALLRLKLHDNEAAWPIAESITKNSNDLYARSKDFLWNLNHNSDDPLELFNYLTAHGQLFYNQFDIAFSSVIKGEIRPLQQLDAFAALNLIFILKEAMTNVMKHANAGEVTIEMCYRDNKVVYALQDNGRWKQQDETQAHYGLTNIERRCEKNNFGFLLSKQAEGTRLEITVPVNISFS
jgi:signal transduction histidine kinase